MDKESLLESAPLFKGRIKDRRSKINENIVKLCLSDFEEDTKFTVDQIKSDIQEKHAIELNSPDIINSLQNLTDDGFISHSSNKEYILDKRPEIDSFDSQFEPVWDEFKQILQTQDIDIDPEFINAATKRAFDDFIFIFFEHIADSAEDIDELNTDTLLIEDYENVINKVIRVNNIQKEDAFRSALIEYLENPGEKLSEFTDRFYTGIVNYNILKKEEDIPFTEIPASGKQLFIDTNVIVALLCETDSLHPLVLEICERSNSLGFDIYYTKGTVSELNRLIRGSKHEMDNLGSSPSEDIINSQFVQEYINSDEWDSWTDYIEYVQKWQNYLDTSLNITKYDDVQTDEDIENFTRKSIRTLERNQDVPDSDRKSVEAVEHDSELLGTVAAIRKSSANNSFQPFILSFDTTINSLSSMGDGTFWDKEVVIQPRNWLNYIVTYTSAEVDEKNTETAVRAVLQSATQFDKGFSIDEYVKLLIPKMGASSEKKEIIKKYIIESPLSEELTNSLERNDLQSATETTKEIFADKEWLETFEHIHDKTEQLRHARETVEEFEERYEKEKELREIYESALTDENKVINLDKILKSSENIDPNELAEVSNEVNSFISLLDSQMENDWRYVELPRPPGHPEEIEEVIQWLDDVVRVLSSTNDLSRGVNSLEDIGLEIKNEVEESFQ